MSFSAYQPFERLGEVIDGSVKPENLHLTNENSDHSFIYFVDSVDNKILKKLEVATNTITTVETRTNKSIARNFHDWDNDKIYFVDCEYDNTISYIWKLDLSDDSVTEIETIPSDVFDIWIYDSDLWILNLTNRYTLPITKILHGITYDGTNYFVTEIDAGNPGNVYKFDTTFSVILNTYPLNAANGSPAGICWDGTFFYIVDSADDAVYQYNNDFSVTVNIHNIGALGGNDSPIGICWNGTKFFVTDIDGNVYEYAADFSTLDNTYNIGALGGNDNPWGIEWDGTSFYVIDNVDDAVYQYPANFAAITERYNIVRPSDPRDICWNGTYFCITENNGKAVYKYTTDFVNHYDLSVKNITDSIGYSYETIGSAANKSWKISQIVVISDQFHFNFKWSNENVEHWHYDVGDDAWTEDEDCGDGTELPRVKQFAMAYDDSDVLYFVLGVGTAEVSTIVAEAAAAVNDGEYILYSAIELDYENVRSEKDYYIWFDKVGDESGDPAVADATGIVCDISGVATAQDVSDVIQAAVDAITIITCANGGGTSTTCTLTCHYNGNTTNIADGDTGWSVATGTVGVDNTYYFYTYEITDDLLTQKGEYNVCLMHNRNTLSTHDMPFDLEKAFDIERDVNDHTKIYQISKGRGTLYAKAQIERGADVIAITDHYIITSDYYLYQWANYIKAFSKRCVIYAKERAAWDADLWVDINWTPSEADWV